MKNNYGILAAVFLILFAGYVYLSSFSITSTANAALGPAFMPQAVAMILFVLGILNLILEGKARKRLTVDRKKEGTGLLLCRGMHRGTYRGTYRGMCRGMCREWIVCHIDYVSGAVLLIYVFCIKPMGFMIASCLYMFVHMMLLTINQKRNYVVIVLLSAAVPCIIYFGFVKIFYLMLPPGILG